MSSTRRERVANEPTWRASDKLGGSTCPVCNDDTLDQCNISDSVWSLVDNRAVPDVPVNNEPVGVTICLREYYRPVESRRRKCVSVKETDVRRRDRV
jgi:hypothetical protein